MTVVLYSSELEWFLRQADLRQPRQRFAIARKIADIYVAENPYRIRSLTFQDPISWASFRWLYRYDPLFCPALVSHVQERSPESMLYTLFLEQRPSEDRRAEGRLHLRPKTNSSSLKNGATMSHER